MTITAQQAIPKHCEPDLAPVCATNAAGQTGSFMNLCIWEQVALAYRWGNYIDNIHSNCDCDMCSKLFLIQFSYSDASKYTNGTCDGKPYEE